MHGKFVLIGALEGTVHWTGVDGYNAELFGVLDW
jgi:hypothetical protein